MGIKGLMTYIISNNSKYSRGTDSNKFLKDFDLHDTHLVIDGNCIMFHMYTSRRCNGCYGGDYAEFAYYIVEFLDDLLKCKVTPIIMIDGALEDKKMTTVLKRSSERVKKAASTTTNTNISFLPLLAKYVFIYLAKERNIKVLQSTLEADHHIASIAMILDCPVLSFDSDFFIYDVKFIPLTKMKIGVVNRSGTLVKQCKIFDRDSFFEEHFNPDRKLLPLAAAVLGNDYLSGEVFKNFFSTLLATVQNSETRKAHLMIRHLLIWLRMHTLDSAVTAIIDTLDQSEKQPILKIIEMIVNGYLNPSEKMIPTLDYSKEQTDELLENVKYKSYKFQSSVDCEIEEIMNDLSMHEKYDIVKPETEDNIEKLVPAWFLAKYNRAEYPAYFLDLINRQHVIFTEQVDDTTQPPCVNISLKIISVIFRLLSSGTSNANCLKYTCRGRNNELETHELDCRNYKLPCDIPLLENLKDLPVLQRQQMLLITLGVSYETLEKFPPIWRLYLAAIKYWKDSADKMFCTNKHLYALILMIIFHVVKRVIGTSPYFQGTNNNIKSINDISMNKSLKEALNEVNEDCVWAEEFFLKNMSIGRGNYDVSIVHAFALFQNCLRYTMDLNSLLGCPLAKINVADFFSGTLAYNLFIDMKSHYPKLNARIYNVFAKCPSILQLFVILFKEIQTMLQNQ